MDCHAINTFLIISKAETLNPTTSTLGFINDDDEGLRWLDDLRPVLTTLKRHKPATIGSLNHGFKGGSSRSDCLTPIVVVLCSREAMADFNSH